MDDYQLYGRTRHNPSATPATHAPSPDSSHTSSDSSANGTHLTEYPKFDQIPTEGTQSTLVWQYGLTTVPSRADTLLPLTLASLRKGGFPSPHLFIDGCTPLQAATEFGHFDLPMTVRGNPSVRVAGNWVLSLYELYYRNPLADRYALFQDDFITYTGLREYLDTCPIFLPEKDGDGKSDTFKTKGYLNLYTMESNFTYFVPRDEQGRAKTGWYRSNQMGKGAVALVFDRQGVIELLCSRHLAKRPSNRERKSNENRWFMAIDGGVVEAMNGSGSPPPNNGAGYAEYVHYPTLTQHTGHVSSREEQSGKRPQPTAVGFMGEGWDVRQLGRGVLSEGIILEMPNKRIMRVARDM